MCTEVETYAKIALVGLEKAGKTSIVYKFFKNWTEGMLENIKPTINIEISSNFQSFIKGRLLIHDFGGQSFFRKQHLKNEQEWRNISALIFIVDIQNKEKFNDAKEYFEQILSIITKVNKKIPKTSIYFHKYDKDKKIELKTSLTKCLSEFEEFVDFASFHLTTITDLSSNIALAKTMYYSLPDIIIRRLLDEEFINYFENKILPRYGTILADTNLTAKMHQQIRKNIVEIGMTYSLSFLQKWIDFITNEELLNQQESKFTKKIAITQEKNLFIIEIKNWLKREMKPELSNILLGGLLEGIFKSILLNAPTIIESDSEKTIWSVKK